MHKINFAFLLAIVAFNLNSFQATRYSGPRLNKRINTEKKSSDTADVQVYPWINIAHRPYDFFQFEDYTNVLGPVQSIREFVVAEKDTMRRIIREALYDVKGRILALCYYYGHQLSSQEIMMSKDGSSYYWTYMFNYGKRRLKEESRISSEGKSIAVVKIPKTESFFDFQCPTILTTDKNTGLVLSYSRENKHTNEGSETIFCEYDTYGRKTIETVKDSVDKVRSIDKIVYNGSEIIVTTFTEHHRQETRYKLDKFGNWIEKISFYHNYAIYGTQIHRREIVYY